MEALHEQQQDFRFVIFSRTPRWFFDEALPGLFTYNLLTTDIGLVQETAMIEDLPETVRRLKGFLPFNKESLDPVVNSIRENGCKAVVCDISPLGIAAASAANIPSVLIENFTWDWIYEGYFSQEPGLMSFSQQLSSIFQSADFHIQTEPVCSTWTSNLVTNPVSRKPRASRPETRRRLGIPETAKVVLITMGGIPDKAKFIHNFSLEPDVFCIIPGGSHILEKDGGLILLPHHSEFYHPDLITACDVVIGKTGYSTVAETYHSGAPFGFVNRPRFREALVLGDYVLREMGGINITAQALTNGEWVKILPDLLSMPRFQRTQVNGAEQIAEYFLNNCLL
jgi:hypothetical protein